MADQHLHYDDLIALPAGQAINLDPGERVILEYFEKPASSNVITVDTAVSPGVVDLRLYPSGPLSACNDTLDSCTLAVGDIPNWAPHHDKQYIAIAATPTKIVFEACAGRPNCWVINMDDVTTYNLVFFGGPYA